MAITRTQIARQLLQFGGGADMGKERGPETGREAGPVGGGPGVTGDRNPMAQFTPEAQKIARAMRDETMGAGDKFVPDIFPITQRLANKFQVSKPTFFDIQKRGLIGALGPQTVDMSGGDAGQDIPYWAQLGFSSEAEYLASLQEQKNMDQETEVAEEDFSLKRRFAADGGRIGLRFGSEGYQGGATTQGGAGRGTDVGRSGGEGNRDRRIVEQYTKPPTVVGGSGDQKTPVVVNPLKNLPTHFANNQKLKDAVALGLITNDEYNILGGYDVKQTMGMGPVDSFIGSLAYNTVQSLKGDQPFGEIFGDAKKTAIGASNISPELQTKYENIMQMADGGRAGLAEGGMPYEGGIMDLESARQMYGLGKLVKKVTRSVKKIAKSDLGKAAILAAGGYYLGGGNLFGLQRAGLSTPGFSFSNFPGASLFSKSTPVKLAKGVADRQVFNAARTAAGEAGKGIFSNLGVGTLIAGTSAIAGLLTPEQEEEAQNISDETGIDIETIRANPNQYLGRRFRAEGGSMKEPVAKKTMPLFDMDGQEMDLRAEGGFVPIGRMEKADDVPARLSKNEFVFTADAVRNAGDGDVDKGAEVMYNMMKNLESGGDVSEESQGLEGARKMFQTSQRLEEVL